MLYSFFNPKNKKSIITDCDIKNKNINEIEELKKNSENEFNLSNNAMTDAFEEQNIDKLQYLKNNFSLNLHGCGNYHIDIAIEEGQTDMSKFLITEFKCQPSLYAKQMAIVNGHDQLSSWVDQNAIQRNQTGINVVHRHYDKEKRQFVWGDYL